MITASLVTAAISIISLYFGLLQLVDSGVIAATNITEIQTPFIYASGIALTTTLFVVLLASTIFFRITQPWSQQAETFHILAKTAHEAIFLIDAHGIIQFVNPAAESLFGYIANELLGKNIKQLMPSPHRELHDSYIENYLKTGIKKSSVLASNYWGNVKMDTSSRCIYPWVKSS